ncbi:hypothetical protein [Desulfuromonas sp. AOP6]|uniref:hypothetical protein n=1 Tax=Desulfuromonas sp. AOP6 TaxID=1566351 RepID=UPI0012DFB7DB|nr:hypothetical protein [Desulfuromonas sp. AOP6]
MPAGMSLLLLVAGLLLAVGLPVLCRLFWVRVDYVLTNHRIYWRGGLLRDRCASRELADLVDFSVDRHGPQLATVSLRFGYERRLLRLFCLEHPETLTILFKPQPGHGKERG